jgi:putative endonuclease
MRAKDAVGRYGEDVAVRHLTDAGLVVLERNWRCRAGEIDIVARDGDVLVFCEVKTRTSDAFGGPAEAVSPAKMRRIRGLACQWLAARRAVPAKAVTVGDTSAPGWLRDAVPADADLRFDVVSVRCPRRGPAAVEHLRGAF